MFRVSIFALLLLFFGACDEKIELESVSDSRIELNNDFNFLRFQDRESFEEFINLDIERQKQEIETVDGVFQSIKLLKKKGKALGRNSELISKHENLSLFMSKDGLIQIGGWIFKLNLEVRTLSILHKSESDFLREFVNDLSSSKGLTLSLDFNEDIFEFLSKNYFKSDSELNKAVKNARKAPSKSVSDKDIYGTKGTTVYSATLQYGYYRFLFWNKIEARVTHDYLFSNPFTGEIKSGVVDYKNIELNIEYKYDNSGLEFGGASKTDSEIVFRPYFSTKRLERYMVTAYAFIQPAVSGADNWPYRPGYRRVIIPNSQGDDVRYVSYGY